MWKKFIIILVINIFLRIQKALNVIEHCCSAYDCKRTCLNSDNVLQTPGDNGFKFEIEGIKDNKYVPEMVYKGQQNFIFLEKI